MRRYKDEDSLSSVPLSHYYAQHIVSQEESIKKKWHKSFILVAANTIGPYHNQVATMTAMTSLFLLLNNNLHATFHNNKSWQHYYYI